MMEVEAWFIGEHTHFDKIDPKLTSSLIKSNLGFDPAVDDATTLLQPAESLDQMYRLVSKEYKKSENQTVANIDYYRLGFELPTVIPQLKILTDKILQFFN